MGVLKKLDADYYFIHLSFQEYFAARYLVSILNSEKPHEAIEFIKRHKYNQRLLLVLSFTTGLLVQTDGQPGTDIFWDTIAGDPLDLLGIRHMHLMIACMEETESKKFAQRQKSINYIIKCIKYATIKNKNNLCHLLRDILCRNPNVVNQSDLVETFTSILRIGNSEMKNNTLTMLKPARYTSLPEWLLSSMILTLKDEDRNVRINVLLELHPFIYAPTNELISALIAALKDEDYPIRSCATRALGDIGKRTATKEVIGGLLLALQNEYDYARMDALTCLGAIGAEAATYEVISAMVAAIHDSAFEVRRNACRELPCMGEKAATNEAIQALLSAVGDENAIVRTHAYEALGQMGEKAETNQVIEALLSQVINKPGRATRKAREALARLGKKVSKDEMFDTLHVASYK